MRRCSRSRVRPVSSRTRAAHRLAGGAVTIRPGIAYFLSDSTLAQYRGRGLQRALIEARLATAVKAGCDLAAVTTLAGTLSQRNYERCGFRVVYTKLNMQRDF